MVPELEYMLTTASMMLFQNIGSWGHMQNTLSMQLNTVVFLHSLLLLRTGSKL